jgi:RNA polymerase sigma-70 factor (ECF subfamily)
MREDEDPIRVIYDASYRRLVGQLYAVCGNRGDAEDAVQEAFVQAVYHRHRFLEMDRPEAWLRTVALNRIRKGWRHGAVARRVLSRGVTPPSAADFGLSPDHVDLVDALGRLTPVLRETFVLHYVVDLTVAAVAAELNVAEGTVKARLSRGRALLADLLSDREGADHV